MRKLSLQFVRRAIVTNWPIKVTALVLSTVLWASFAAEEPTTQLVPVRVEIVPPAGRSLTSTVPPVQALYAGSARELIKLYTSPPIVRKEIPDTLTGTTYPIHLTPEDLTIGHGVDAKAQDVQPRTFVVELDDLAQRTVPVTARVVISPDSGFAILGGVAVVPGSVTVRGSDAAIRTVRDVPTVPMQLNGVTEPVHREVELDTTHLGGARVSPSTVDVTADVVAMSERVLMGIPVVVQSDRGGNWVTDPPAVMVAVRGPSARIARLTRDSLTVLATPSGTGTPEVVHVTVMQPAGLAATATPDTVVVQRRGRG